MHYIYISHLVFSFFFCFVVFVFVFSCCFHLSLVYSEFNHLLCTFLFVFVLVPCYILSSFDIVAYSRPVFVIIMSIFLVPLIKLIYFAVFFLIFCLPNFMCTSMYMNLFSASYHNLGILYDLSSQQSTMSVSLLNVLYSVLEYLYAMSMHGKLATH